MDLSPPSNRSFFAEHQAAARIKKVPRISQVNTARSTRTAAKELINIQQNRLVLPV
jgi:hypothetical protein